MSFLFKSSKKGQPSGNALPPATRNLRSAEGGMPDSNVPTVNGVIGAPISANGSRSRSPASPTPGATVNGSLNSLAGRDEKLAVKGPVDQQKDRSVGDRDPEKPGWHNSGPPSLEQKLMRQMPNGDTGPPHNRIGPPMRPPPSGESPYPWSQRTLHFTISHTNPFPRYGAAVNATASKDGAIYLMGGLINGSTVKGDLWMVECGSGNMACYPVATTSEGPGPRVGHASLLVGNAFIVFGGDTKMDEGDLLDDTLYLLNTSTKQWSRALPAGPRPPGRYGHTLNILGSKIYIFGGQVEGYFFNDLVAFDLNALQQASNRWEILIQNTIDGGPPHGQIPPARTNHSLVTWQDKLYLFGGTDGVQWFSDVWSYDPRTNSWTQLECIGYIPAAREGHAAALVGDVMYIFGGRTEEGNDLGDLAAFRISSKRWYTFQNMGPSPSPRSGHSMTSFGKNIVVLAGEPSSAPRDPNELSLAYFLDTNKIRYPPDSASQTPSSERIQGTRRPSGEKSGIPQGRGMPSRELMDNEIGGARRMPQQREVAPAPPRQDPGDFASSRLPRAAGIPAPSGPPPQQQPPQPRINGIPGQTRQPTRPDRAFSPQNETRFDQVGRSSPRGMRRDESPAVRNQDMPSSPTFGDDGTYFNSESQPQPPPFKPEADQPKSAPEGEDGSLMRSSSRAKQNMTNMDRFDETPRPSIDQQMRESMPQVLDIEEHEREHKPVDSGLGSSPALSQQNDELVRHLEEAKSNNAWYASELALARKAGYKSDTANSPVLYEHTAEAFGAEDRPLIEALLKMRSELARVQDTIDAQAKSAAERVAETEKQRDAAINEAVFAKAKLAGQGISMPDGSRGTPDQDREHGMSKKLAASLATRSGLSRKIEALAAEVEAERNGRQLAEDLSDAAQKRVTELDMHRQHNTAEIESLRSELHEVQKQAREEAANGAEAVTAHRMLQTDHKELQGKHESALAETQHQASVLSNLREAVTASSAKSDLLGGKLDEERSQRDSLEEKLTRLKSQLEERTTELDTSQRRLRDAEEIAERHAEEARTHRQAVLAGLGKVTDRDIDPHEAADERVIILQQQVEAANALVRNNQAAADAASEKLRRAEERIAGLEAYQEQASREGLHIRKQLKNTMKETQGLSAEKNDLQQQLQSQLLETNAISVQHGALKDILGGRGINASEVRRSRALDSPASLLSNRISAPDLNRTRELEQQVEDSLKSHDAMKAQFEEVQDRDANLKRDYEEKLTALDNDHQAAVKYLRGTEKMLSKMKQELQRVKNENTEHRKELEKLRTGENRATPDVPGEWEQERDQLKNEIEEVQNSFKASLVVMEGQIEKVQGQLQNAETELSRTRSVHATTQADLASLHATHSASRGDIERLQKENSMLEERAHDAENKVQLLLDQVETSVDNYRRQSRIPEAVTPTMNGVAGHHRNFSNASESTAATPINGHGHHRNTSAGGDSIYSQTAPSITSATGERPDARNSLALDSLASELDALRSHWETTNKNYRLSDRFDFEKTPHVASGVTDNMSSEYGSLATWRRGLDIGDDDDDKSRPTTSDGTEKGAGARASLEPHGAGEAVTTRGGMI